MPEELKPCPKCKENVELYFSLHESDHPHDDDYLEARPSCGCRFLFKYSVGYNDEEEREDAKRCLIENWNDFCREAESRSKLIKDLEAILSILEAKAMGATLEEWRDSIVVMPDGSLASAVSTAGGDEICNMGQSLSRDEFDSAFIAAANPVVVLRLVELVRKLISRISLYDA